MTDRTPDMFVSPEKTKELRMTVQLAAIADDPSYSVYATDTEADRLRTENDELREKLTASQDARVRAASGFTAALSRAQTANRDTARQVVFEILTALKGNPDDTGRRVAVVLLRHAAVLGLDQDSTDNLTEAAGDDAPDPDPSGPCPCGGTGDRHKGGAKCRLFDRPGPDDDTDAVRASRIHYAWPTRTPANTDGEADR